MGIGAAAALAAGWLQPAPWLLAAMLGAMMTVLWLVVVGLFLRADAWSEAQAADAAEAREHADERREAGQTG
jgi:hypothetical protein